MQNSTTGTDPRKDSRASGESTPTVLDNSAKRFIRFILGLMALGVYWLIWTSNWREAWGDWSMRGKIGAAVLPVGFVLIWLPIMWAALRWAIRDLIRARRLPTRGKHAKKPRPRLAIICFLISAGILAGVVYPSWNQHLTLAQDLWEGPVRHERVACEAFNDGNGSVSPKSRSWKYLQFKLVGDDGYSQSFRFKRVDLDKETDRQGSPFNTILGACESPEMRMSVSVYPRTGVIFEARASK